jgi:PAS domain-containing protein
MTATRETSTDPVRQQELETLYRTAPLGMGLVDRDLRYVRVNERLAQFAGRSAAQHAPRRTASGTGEPVIRRSCPTAAAW